MSGSRSSGLKSRNRLVALLAAGTMVLCAGGCGGASTPSTTEAADRAGAGVSAAEITSSKNCTGERQGSSPEVTYCEFVLSGGRRFKCQGSGFDRSQPSAGELSDNKACIPLSRVAIPVVPGTVLTQMARVRTCLTHHDLQVSGGPAGPEGPGQPTGPYGVLYVVSAFSVPGYTVTIAFDRHSQGVKRRKGHVIRVADREEHHGAVSVTWHGTPAKGLRTSVRACAFG